MRSVDRLPRPHPLRPSPCPPAFEGASSFFHSRSSWPGSSRCSSTTSPARQSTFRPCHRRRYRTPPPFSDRLRSEMSLMPYLSAVSRVTQMPCVGRHTLGAEAHGLAPVDVFLDECIEIGKPDFRIDSRPRRNPSRRMRSCVPISRTSASRSSFCLMPYLMMLAAAWPDGQLGIAMRRSAAWAGAYAANIISAASDTFRRHCRNRVSIFFLSLRTELNSGRNSSASSLPRQVPSCETNSSSGRQYYETGPRRQERFFVRRPLGIPLRCSVRPTRYSLSDRPAARNVSYAEGGVIF